MMKRKPMKRKPMKRLFALVLAACLLLAGLPLSAGATGSVDYPISVGLSTLIYGSISEDEDGDYYEFTIPETGTIELKAEADVSQIYLRIYSSENERIIDEYYLWDSTTEKLVLQEEFYLKGGTYCLAINKRNGRLGNYQFAIEFTSANETMSIRETSSSTNDTVETADYITLGNQYYAQMSSGEENDYYHIATTRAGRINLRFVGELAQVYLRLYDGHKNQIWGDYYIWNSTTQQFTADVNLDITAGDYYLLVLKRNGRTGNYSFSTEFSSANESFKENMGGSDNGLDTANSIELDTQYNGQIALNDDRDFYEFSCSSGTLDFVFSSAAEQMYARIYDADGNEVWDDYFIWNSTTQRIDAEREVTLESGNYYLCLLERNSRTGPYTFALSTGGTPIDPGDPENPEEPEEPSGLPFKDVHSGDYFYNPVKWAVENGITSGTSATAFSPNAGCTRAQAMTFLWKAAGQPEPTRTSNPFRDVKSSDYYYKAVLWAVENNITAGTSATTFGPNEGCTRGQIMTFLYKAAGSPSVSGSNPFRDVASGDYFYRPVLWAVRNNITAGTSATTFSPNDGCTRGQIVTFLYKHYAS